MLYRVAPTPAITFCAEIERIGPYVGTDEPEGKYRIVLKGGPLKVAKPVGIGKNANLTLGAPRNALLADIVKVNPVADLFPK